MGAGAVAINDLVGSVRGLPLAFVLAMDDIQGRYRRTVLGPLWIVLGQAATIGGFVLVFSGLWGIQPAIYALYLAAGFPVWMLISQYLADMPLAFIFGKPYIESYELPWLLQVWRRSIGYILLFGHQILPLFVVMVVLGVMPSPNMLYVIPALAILMVAGTGLGMLLALFGARYRDLQPAMGVSTGFLFLFTPVMWRAEQLHTNHWAVQFNPLYYFVELVRNPLLGVAPTNADWIWTSVSAVVIFALGFLAYVGARRRLYHWL